MSNDAEQHQHTLKALEDELNHYIQLCQSQKELLHRYIKLQKKTLRQLHSRAESYPDSV